jgi:hypothetical protein
MPPNGQTYLHHTLLSNRIPESMAPERTKTIKNAVNIEDRGINVIPSNQNIKRIIPIVIYRP